jgi:signal transduction histidine kinase
MNKGSTAVLGADVVGQRSQEFPAFTASNRVCMSVLLGLVLLSVGRSQPWVWLVVLFFGVAAVVNLWRVSTGRASSDSSLLFYWAAATVVLVVARGTAGGALLLVLFLYPLSMCTVLHGVRHGLALAATSAAVWLLDFDGLGLEPSTVLPALALVLVPLITSVAAYPLAALRQRVQLVAELEQELDPRRGLAAVGLVVGERLRAATAARRVLVCHRDAEVPTVLVCDAEDGSFVASEALSSRVLALLAVLPAAPQDFQARSGLTAGGLENHRPSADQQPQPQGSRISDLAQLLEAERLQLVPDAPGKASTGWILAAYGSDHDRRYRPWPLQPLAGFAADLRRLLQQASYVDRLQEEIAAHERSRIGRDLHDSAIQPYLGLKFAIEGLALRCDAGNPLQGQIQELRAVCDAELVELRKTVSALRAGHTSGENSLSAALQRQCSRFARLFEIQVDLQVPAELPASRTLVSALLHMVDEALNNVRRHTQAQRVWISLSDVPGALRLVIRDDAGQRSGQAAPAFEPRSLTERARELGGALVLRQHNGLDTEIHITLPT